MKQTPLLTLDKLVVGQSGMVCTLPHKAELKRRLMALGMIAGTRITAVNKSPCRDPTAYFFRGSVIALRQKDAKTITVAVSG